jgi:hypothetical protein
MSAGTKISNKSKYDICDMGKLKLLSNFDKEVTIGRFTLKEVKFVVQIHDKWGVKSY